MRPTLAEIQTVRPLIERVRRARSTETVLTEIINDIKTQILAEGRYVSQYDGKRITDPKRDWTMGSKAFQGYANRLDMAVRAAGFDVPEGHCPALVASELRVQAEHALIHATAPMFGLTFDAINMNMENRQKWIDLHLGLNF